MPHMLALSNTEDKLIAGSGNTGIATNEVPGIVKGNTVQFSVSVNADGTMTIVGLVEYLQSVDASVHTLNNSIQGVMTLLSNVSTEVINLGNDVRQAIPNQILALEQEITQLKDRVQNLENQG